MSFNIPFFGEVTVSGLIFAGIAGLVGYIIGSQLKSAIKIALIILLVVAVLGLITPAMLGQLAEWVAALKPLLTNFLSSQAQGAISLSFVCFVVGFIVGLVKG